MLKKLLAVVLCSTLIATLLPVGSSAEKGSPSNGSITVIEETVAVDKNWEEEYNDELFAQYLDNVVFGTGIQKKVALYGASSTENVVDGLGAKEQVLYRELAKKIKTVAASGGSAEFSIPIKEISTSWPTSFNAAGVEANCTYGELVLKLIDIRSVVNALLADYPYDLYWFDKTVGYSYGMPLFMETTDNEETVGYNGSTPIKQTVTRVNTFNGVPTGNSADEVITVIFAPAQKYSAPGESYTVTTSVNIKDEVDRVIAAANEGGNKTNYDKILAYKEYICSQVSYDKGAVDDKSTPYGDPWQLISVFDGDSGTNVVCEGYSKAFKYLCDKSNIPCIIATGQMTGGTGAGGHMWNIVTLGGKNYLVDVTNCDDGSVGSTGSDGTNGGTGLFLKGANGGSVNAGYSYPFPGQTIRFQYDSDTLNNYTSARLSLADIDYDPKNAEKTVTGISVTAQPTKKDYFEGEVLDTAGLKITISYSDTTTEEVAFDNRFTLSETELKTPGTNRNITVTYGNRTATFHVNVTARTLTGIEITEPPTRKIYYPGEVFDPAGMTLKASYNTDEAVTGITGYTIKYPDGGNSFKIGDTNVTISYTVSGVTKEIEVTGITVSRRPITVPAVTWSLTSTVYNAENQTTTITAGLPSGVYVSSYENNSKRNAGTYTATAHLAVTDTTNTVLASGSDTKTLSWEITKRPITVTASNVTVKKPLGEEPAPEVPLTYSPNTLLGTDTFTGNISCEKVIGEGKLVDNTAAGTYGITRGNLGINDGNPEGNYTLTFNNGTLTVTETKVQNDIDSTSTPITKTYGESYSITYSKGKDADNKDYLGTITYNSSNTNVATVSSNGAVTILKSGTTTLTAVGTLTTDGSIKNVSKSYTLTVNKKDVTISPRAVSINVNGTLPTISTLVWNKSGLVGSDDINPILTSANFAITDSGSNAVTDSTKAGTYSIKVTGAIAPESEKYNVTINGETTLTISQSSYRPVTPPSSSNNNTNNNNNTNTNTNNTTQATISSDKTSNVNTTVSGSNVTVSNISATTVNNIANSANTNNSTITIDVSKVSKEEVSSVTITKETASNLATALDSTANKAKAVEIKMTNFTVSLDSTALSGLAKAGTDNVKLVVDTVAQSSLNTNQRAELAKSTVVETFEAHFETAVGQRITGITGNMTIGRIGFKAESGRSINHYHVIYLPSTGEAVRHKTYYKDGFLLFDTNHNSDYAIVYDEKETNATAVSVYRLYNKNNGDHFYTTHLKEYEFLITQGLQDEKVAFTASMDEDALPVYRLYNPNSGEHFYTTSVAEKNNCIKHNWSYEGIEFRAKGTIPVYRVYNPGGLHLLTMKLGEVDYLTKLGWINEGVAFHVGR